jgi:integrase
MNTVRCVLKQLKEKLRLKKLTAHQFRRTWATHYRRMGGGPLDLQQEGGWEV